jgi:hypothetical protein
MERAVERIQISLRRLAGLNHRRPIKLRLTLSSTIREH